ncbi:hypothetical protein C2S52_008968 [Perilla frutescens var. hirtella]|uniref:Late embryogenesis abundant protein LEA-2 subgroup domain-containing protein n=1 Tax=Perilla frutescens var. hirtella TaxID=608512 RepID=A0AAD4JL00_PERFH|nr:hypothetical protein C2S51_017497 [Perilla frutescens var. frutescens]KAH6784009.1 hypothetical protein C2S52_008968 [Perilla frutescens var. hirtella]KAH6835023.1 hypothetical protein C2S53_011630 [Perilla frutescens var. hirtella]
MAEKEQQSAHPANGNGNGYARSGGDTEAAAAALDARELRKKKRTKCFLYVVLFVIFQTGVITLFALTVMKVRTPKFRVSDASVTNFNAGAPANPSLRATVNALFTVKNTNFGRYKYRNTTVDLFYKEVKVGEVLVPNSRANWRSTRKFNVDVDLNIVGSPQLGSDLSAGVVPITSRAQMRGRVELMFIMKKNRATNMDCSMDIVIATQTIRNIVCK